MQTRVSMTMTLIPRLALAALAALALFSPAHSLGQDPSSESVAAKWGVPAYLDHANANAFAPTWSKRLTGYITTRDGVPLRFSALLPQGSGPYPVIVNYSGYDPGAIGGLSYLHDNTAMSTSLDRTLLAHGFAVVGVNARGTGCSEGTFDFLGPAYGTDGADIVEWIARQSWSNGAVGMANWSWAGMSQVATASERPAHLRAIAPGMVLTDPRLDSWAIGGVPSQGFVTGWWQFLHSRWLAVRRSAVAEHDDRCLAQVDRNYRTGETAAVNLPSLLLRHPLRDGWIEARTILKHVDRIAVPVLSMEAFQDEATTARGGYYQDRLDPKRLWLVQTNGNHDLYESLRFRETLVAFLDRFVKGVNNGFESTPHVEVWGETTTTGTSALHDADEKAVPRWVMHRNQFPVAVTPLVFALTSGNLLIRDGAPSGPPDTYVYPVNGPTVNADYGSSKWGPLQPAWRQGSLAYTSAPLRSDLLIYGPASADLWVASTASDTDLQVTLTDLRPDGQEEFVQRGWLRMSDRKLNDARSTATRPSLCDRIECISALTPEVPALGRVELTKVMHPFRAGSRVRIWIEAPSATGENSFDHSSLPSTNAVWHDAEHRSKLVLGVLSQVSIPKSTPACGAVLMQPCRADPLRER